MVVRSLVTSEQNKQPWLVASFLKGKREEIVGETWW